MWKVVFVLATLAVAAHGLGFQPAAVPEPEQEQAGPVKEAPQGVDDGLHVKQHDYNNFATPEPPKPAATPVPTAPPTPEQMGQRRPQMYEVAKENTPVMVPMKQRDDGFVDDNIGELTPAMYGKDGRINDAVEYPDAIPANNKWNPVPPKYHAQIAAQMATQPAAENTMDPSHGATVAANNVAAAVANIPLGTRADQIPGVLDLPNTVPTGVATAPAPIPDLPIGPGNSAAHQPHGKITARTAVTESTAAKGKQGKDVAGPAP